MKCYCCWFWTNLLIYYTAYTALKCLTRLSTILFPSKASLINNKLLYFSESAAVLHGRFHTTVLCILYLETLNYIHILIALGSQKIFKKIKFNESFFIRHYKGISVSSVALDIITQETGELYICIFLVRYK
jgi:hypothetical protein